MGRRYAGLLQAINKKRIQCAHSVIVAVLKSVHAFTAINDCLMML
jgi:hypothetical protein